MNRAILEAWLPCVMCLAIGCAALWLVVRMSGAKLQLARLRQLHRCEDGGVQSLSFVLTLPLFVMILMLIVQISQLMIGMVYVNYAAFAAARAASVWIPAQTVPWASHNDEEDDFSNEFQNRFDGGLPLGDSDPNDRLRLLPFNAGVQGQYDASVQSYKYAKIRTAAVMGCAPVSPSRDIHFTSGQITPASQTALQSAQVLYPQLAPGAANNPRIGPRLANKIGYADRNTCVFVEWRDARTPGGTNSTVGKSYNPVNSAAWSYHPNEVGWQDPVTVYVVHRFALFPGPGRFLTDLLIRPLAAPPRIQQQVPPEWLNSYISEAQTYSVLIPAAVTLSTEGFKSEHPYVQTSSYVPTN